MCDMNEIEDSVFVHVTHGIVDFIVFLVDGILEIDVTGVLDFAEMY
jgi:hypothetical protein